MSPDKHDRARTIIDQAALDSVLPADQRWLDGHLRECGDCARYAELSERAVRALGAFSFDVDPAAALRIEQTVRVRAEQAAASPVERIRALAFPIAAALTVAGSVVVWQLGNVLAAKLNVPPPAWHAVFVAFWVVPSAIVDGVLLLRGRVEGEGTEGGWQ